MVFDAYGNPVEVEPIPDVPPGHDDDAKFECVVLMLGMVPRDDDEGR